MWYLKLLAGMIALVIIFSLFQFILSIHPPRFKDTLKPSDYGLEYENITFRTEDNIRIAAWWIKANESKGTVIVGHGYPFDKGNILPIALFLYPDYNLLYYDHRYFGQSEGWISTVGVHEPKDIEAAVEYVKKKHAGRIILYGFSLSASSMLLSNIEVDAIIADSPYADLDRMVHQIYHNFGPLRWPFVIMTRLYAKIFLGVYPSDISVSDKVRDSKTPILIIHGEMDSQIPVENAYKLKEVNGDIDLWIVKGVDHGYAQARHKKEYERKVKDFLVKSMT